MPVKRTADQRLQRLLAIVPWVAERDGPRLDEVCARFDCSEQELVEDLRQLFLCGLYPYTPDVLIDVDIAEGRVWINYADYFSRPLRLSATEALGVLAAGQGAMAAPGADPDGPLARGLEKLGRALGVQGGEALDISLGGVAEGIMQAVTPAVEARLQVEIDYYTFGRDESTTRVIDPLAVFSAGGQWYLSAYCHRVEDERLFRMDRVRSLRVLDTHFVPPPEPPGLTVYQARPGDPRITLELEAGARWVIEQYPMESVEDVDGGGARVTLAVSSLPWVERLLLRLGPDATVCAPPAAPDGAAPDGAVGGEGTAEGDGGTGGSLVATAARRVLTRYRREGSGSLSDT